MLLLLFNQFALFVIFDLLLYSNPTTVKLLEKDEIENKVGAYLYLQNGHWHDAFVNVASRSWSTCDLNCFS